MAYKGGKKEINQRASNRLESGAPATQYNSETKEEQVTLDIGAWNSVVPILNRMGLMVFVHKVFTKKHN